MCETDSLPKKNWLKRCRSYVDLTLLVEDDPIRSRSLSDSTSCRNGIHQAKKVCRDSCFHPQFSDPKPSRKLPYNNSCQMDMQLGGQTLSSSSLSSSRSSIISSSRPSIISSSRSSIISSSRSSISPSGISPSGSSLSSSLSEPLGIVLPNQNSTTFNSESEQPLGIEMTHHHHHHHHQVPDSIALFKCWDKKKDNLFSTYLEPQDNDLESDELVYLWKKSFHGIQDSQVDQSSPWEETWETCLWI